MPEAPVRALGVLMSMCLEGGIASEGALLAPHYRPGGTVAWALPHSMLCRPPLTCA